MKTAKIGLDLKLAAKYPDSLEDVFALQNIADFNTYKKINSIFLKFDHSLLRMPKIIEIGLIFSAEKRDSKT